MKKLIVLLAFMVTVSFAWAQSVFTPTSDTNTNVQTKFISTALLPSNSGNMVFQYSGTKVSGTVAGVVKLQGTLDGVNYISEADTLALTDIAINSKIWDVSDKKRLRWRLSVTTSGTTKVANKGYFSERKP